MFVLFDYQDNRTINVFNSEVVAAKYTAVKIFCNGSKSNNLLIVTITANAYGGVFDSLFCLRIQIIFALASGKFGIQPFLGLFTQIFLHAGEDNDDSVSCIGCFVADCSVVCCLAGLNITEHQAFDKKLLLTWITAKVQNFIRDFTEICCNARIPMFYFFEILFIAIPEEKVEIGTFGGKP